tara:strand:- start:15378 stop:15863 length:486 start_codon:yes stop_codon:yes gene_type:complete
MSIEQPMTADLKQLLQNELEALRRLADVLQQEQQALLDNDVPAIEVATREKNDALAQQADGAARRADALATLGFVAERQTLRSFLERAADADELLALQGALNDLAAQCHEDNRNNGRLIAQRQQQSQGALKVLRQMDGAAPTYSGSGDAVESGASRLLGKA